MATKLLTNIALYWLALFTALATMVVTADGQGSPTTESDARTRALFAVAAKATRPTNNQVELLQGAGEVVVFGSKGFILKSNDDYLPRVALTNITEKDFSALLESKPVYDALTIFGYGSPRTGESTEFESRLREIWLNGKSLSDKIRTRAAILDDLRGYNDAVTSYNNSVGLAQNAIATQKSAINAEQTDAGAVSNATAQLESAGSRRVAHDAKKDLRAATSDLGNVTVTANGAASLASAMAQHAEGYRQICALYATQLSHYRITVNGEPPFVPIPPLSMRLEVDVDRISSPRE